MSISLPGGTNFQLNLGKGTCSDHGPTPKKEPLYKTQETRTVLWVSTATPQGGLTAAYRFIYKDLGRSSATEPDV